MAGVWAAIEQVAPRERLAAAVHTVEELAPPHADDEGAWRAELVKRFAVVRGFVPLLAEVIALGARGPGQVVLDAVGELPDLLGRKRVREGEIRPELVVGSWRRLVHGSPDLPAGVVDRQAYVLCVLEALWKALRHREVYALDSTRWGDPRARLLDGPAWERIRPQVLLAVKLTDDVEGHLAEQCALLDGAWRHLAARLAAAHTGGQGTQQGTVRVEVGRDGRAGDPRGAAGQTGGATQPGGAAGACRADAAPARPRHTRRRRTRIGPRLSSGQVVACRGAAAATPGKGLRRPLLCGSRRPAATSSATARR